MIHDANDSHASGNGDIDALDRLPKAGSRGAYLKQQLQDKLIEHRQYINKHGEDMPEIRDWAWPMSTERG